MTLRGLVESGELGTIRYLASNRTNLGRVRTEENALWSFAPHDIAVLRDRRAAHVFVSWLHPFKEQRLVVIGSKRMASFDDIAKELILYDQRVDLEEGQPVPFRGPGVAVEFPRQEPLQAELEHFVACIETRRRPLTDGWSGLRVLEILYHAQRSMTMGGSVVPVP